MGFRLSKSINIGGIRFNLSSSGVGVSTGIKGLRVGINSSGKPYVAGGSHGVYFRKNLGGNQSKQTNHSGYSQSEHGHSGYGQSEHDLSEYRWRYYSTRQKVMYVLFGILGLVLFIQGAKATGLGKSAVLMGIGVSFFIYNAIDVFIARHKWYHGSKSFHSSVLQLKQNIKQLVEQGNTNEIIALIKEIKANNFDEESIAYIFDDTYYTFLKNALRDRVLSDDEIAIINELKSHISANEYEELNNNMIMQLFGEMLEDRKITKEEEDSLLHIMSVLQLSDTARNRILTSMNVFRK